MQLRRRDELLDALGPEHEAEVRVPEFALEAALLLLLHAPAGFERDPDHPFEILVRHRHRCIGKQQLRQAADSLVDGLDVTPAQRAAEVHAALQHSDPIARPQPGPALAEEIAHQSEVVREVLCAFSFGKSQPGA